MVKSKFKIVIVDKKGKYSILFQGFRKNKFTVSTLQTAVNLSSEEIAEYHLFFVVLYEFKDVFELLQLNNSGIPIITASENVKILKKIQAVDSYQCMDLSRNINVLPSLHDCMTQILRNNV